MIDSMCSYSNKPVVGVLVGNGTMRSMHKQIPQFKSQALVEANKISNVTLYFFCLKDVNPNLKIINGTYFDQNGGAWTKGVFPYPHVLYRRGGPSLRREKLKTFWNQLEQMGSKQFNGPAFNKWTLYNVLKKNKELAHHLPATALFKEIEDLKSILNKNKTIYLKACRGSKGQQIMRIEQLSPDFFEYRHFRHKILHKAVVSFTGLTKQIFRFFKDKPFILQETIDLPNLGECIYDMRSEVQRNGKGKLEIVEILVRVANPGAPITQFSSSYLFNDFFSKFTNHSRQEVVALKSYIKKFLVNVYTTVEKEFGPYGEIGIDFAIDKKGKLWFIECNSQPAKVSLIKASSKETIQRVFLNPLEYAKFITNAN